MQDKKEIFEINPKEHTARWNYLFKLMIQIVKGFHQKQIEEEKKYPAGLLMHHTYTLKDKVAENLDNMISICIIQLLCFEKKYKDKSLCREIHTHGYSKELNNMYRLDADTTQIMQEEINIFIDIYLSKTLDEDICNADFDERKTAILTTLEKAEKEINILANYKCKNDVHDKACTHIRNEYSKLVNISKSKVIGDDVHQKFNALKVALKDAKMNYLIKIDGKYIYPFLYDLILMSFSLRLTIAVHIPEFTNSSALANEVDRIEDLYMEEDITDYYLYKELIRLIRKIPDEAKELKNFSEDMQENHESINDLQYIHPTTLLLIKHYSEVLKVECKKVLSVFHQLAFEGNYKKSRTENKCTKKIEDIQLSFHPDSLREISLYCI